MTATPKKGRPTPKAPQNRPRAARGPATIPSRRERFAAMTPEQRERAVAALRYRAHRRATRPFRRAFSATGLGMPQARVRRCLAALGGAT